MGRALAVGPVAVDILLLAYNAGAGVARRVLALHVLDQRHRVTELQPTLRAPLEPAGLYQHAAGAALHHRDVATVSVSDARHQHTNHKNPHGGHDPPARQMRMHYGQN